MESTGGDGATGMPVVKPSAIIHVAGNLGRKERLLYNILLHHAQSIGLSPGRVYRLPMLDLLDRTGTKTRNYDYHADLIRGLVHKPCRFNIHSKDDRSADAWRQVESHLLADASFECRDITTCDYSFPPQMVPLLASPALYCRVWIDRELELRHKASIPLYEYYLDALTSYRNVAEIRIPLEQIRAQAGVAAEQLTAFSHFRRDVLDKAHAEISAKTDLSVEIIDQIRRSRLVTGVIVRLLRRDDRVCDVASSDPPESTADLRSRLSSCGLKGRVLESILSEYSADRILRNLAYTERAASFQKIRNTAGYLRRAIEEDFDRTPKPSGPTSAPSSVDTSTPQSPTSRGRIATHEEPDPWLALVDDYLARCTHDELRSLWSEFLRTPIGQRLIQSKPNASLENPVDQWPMKRWLIENWPMRSGGSNR